jgi:hypothetical protein
MSEKLISSLSTYKAIISVETQILGQIMAQCRHCFEFFHQNCMKTKIEGLKWFCIQCYKSKNSALLDEV